MAIGAMSAANSPLSATKTEARQTAQAYLNSRLTNSGNRANEADSTFTIPNIDISSSFSANVADRKNVAAQIHTACTNSGFFTITGHSISEDTRQAILSQTERFLQHLPREKKESLHIKHSPYFRGWEPAEYTYVNPADWEGESVPETKEGFNWGYEDGLAASGGDGTYVELDGSRGARANVWPAEGDLLGFYEGVREYYSQVLELARHLFRLFALSLGLEETYFDAVTTHPGGIARLLYYPPSKSNDESNALTIGLGAHSDYECFTILLSSSTPGLEILSPSNA